MILNFEGCGVAEETVLRVAWVPPKALPDTKICVCVYLRDDLGGQE